MRNRLGHVPEGPKAIIHKEGRENSRLGWRLVKRLPRKHENLSLISRTHVRRPGVVVCACDPSIGEVRQISGIQ